MKANVTETQGYSRARIEQLAQPKKSKQEWLTNFEETQLRWGDKDTMCRLSRATLEAKCGQRTGFLAKSKRDWKDHTNEVHLYTYSCGRESPLQKLGKVKRQASASSRIKLLAQPKQLPSISGKLWTYSCGRESPIWHVTPPSKERPSSGDRRLAKPKQNHKGFVRNRELRHDGRMSGSFIKKLVARGDDVCTERLEVLAQSKQNRRSEENFIDLMQPEKCIRPVMRASLEATATNRVVELAQPNDSRYDHYIPDRFEWPVSQSALRATCSDNTEKLATPVIRPSMEHTQYDANAFFVKAAAKKASCSQRLESLSRPLQRN